MSFKDRILALALFIASWAMAIFSGYGFKNLLQALNTVT